MRRYGDAAACGRWSAAVPAAAVSARTSAQETTKASLRSTPLRPRTGALRRAGGVRSSSAAATYTRTTAQVIAKASRHSTPLRPRTGALRRAGGVRSSSAAATYTRTTAQVIAKASRHSTPLRPRTGALHGSRSARRTRKTVAPVYFLYFQKPPANFRAWD